MCVLCVLSFICIVLHTFSTLLRHEVHAKFIYVQKNNMNCTGISQVAFFILFMFFGSDMLVIISMLYRLYAMKGQVLKMVYYNCQGLIMKEKRGDVLNYLYSKVYNIYCLQDTHFVEQDEVQIKNQWQGECILIHLHLTREVLLYLSKITLNLKLTKLKKMIMTTFLD